MKNASNIIEIQNKKTDLKNGKFMTEKINKKKEEHLLENKIFNYNFIRFT